MKYKDENGNWIDIHVKAIDSLPIGTILDYDGEEIPDGYEETIDPNEYSTEEQVIGTFLGKPLYRRVVTGTISGTSTPILLEHKNLISIKGEIIGNNGGTNSINYYYSNDNYSYVYSHSYSEVRILTSSTNHNKEYYIILEYTKTTD